MIAVLERYDALVVAGVLIGLLFGLAIGYFIGYWPSRND